MSSEFKGDQLWPPCCSLGLSASHVRSSLDRCSFESLGLCASAGFLTLNNMEQALTTGG